jgi:capsular polysaccharide biosynthesis protein
MAEVSAQQYYYACQDLREILTRDVEKYNPHFGDKIYISREGQVLRFVENEKEVMELLGKYGFKKIIAEKYSYEQQIAIFSKAKYVVKSRLHLFKYFNC